MIDLKMPAQLKTVNRYRDVTLRPDGLALFIVTDNGGNTQDQSGRPAARVENPGAILEFRYTTARIARPPGNPVRGVW